MIETKAIDLYINLLKQKLNGYSTTYDEDVEILNSKDDSISPRLIAATRYRHSKKRIIRKQLEILNALRPLVSLLLVQEQTGLFPSDSKSLRVKSLKKYVDSIMDMATHGMDQLKIEQQGKSRVDLGDNDSGKSTRLVMGRHVVSSSTPSIPKNPNVSKDNNYMLDLNAMDDEFLISQREADEKKKTEELLERLTQLDLPSE